MRSLIIAIIIALGILSSGSAASAAVPSGQPKAFSMLGVANVGDETVVVDVVVAVQPGQNAAEVARAALAAQGARPFESANLGSEGFTVLGLVWDVLPVVQNYNPGSPKTQDEPAGIAGETALTNTHTTWDGVITSSFDINFGGTTDRCPSLVRECKGRQKFDGNNDVAWLQLEGNVLGVTWFSTSIDEADIALNTNFTWNDGCTDEANSFDAQTVFLHENGHIVGLGHSDDAGSVLQPVYHGADCDLGTDDQEGATYLYDSDVTGSVFGTVTDGTNPIEGATVVLEGTGLWATTAADGTYTISGGVLSSVPDPVTYTVTASAADHESATILRLNVDGAVTGVNFALATGGGDGGGGTVIVSVESIIYTTAGGPDGKKHLNITVAIVDNLGNPVSGAVEIRLFHIDSDTSWSDTGSTYPDNTFTFTLKNAPSGCYTTEVENVVTAQLIWDGVTPTNGTCK